MKYSWKAIPRDEKQLMKKYIQDNFSLSCTSVVKMHWKPDRNYLNYVRFGQNKNLLELLNIIFENSSPKGYFGANKINWIFASVAGFLKITDNLS